MSIRPTGLQRHPQRSVSTAECWSRGTSGHSDSISSPSDARSHSRRRDPSAYSDLVRLQLNHRLGEEVRCDVTKRAPCSCTESFQMLQDARGQFQIQATREPGRIQAVQRNVHEANHRVTDAVLTPNQAEDCITVPMRLTTTSTCSSAHHDAACMK